MLAFSGIENTPTENTDTARGTATNNIMGGFTEEEGSLVLLDGTSLYSKSWKVCQQSSLFDLLPWMDELCWADGVSGLD